MARPGRNVASSLEEIVPPVDFKVGDPFTQEEVCTPDDVAEVLELDETPAAPWAERQIAAALRWAQNYLGMPWLGNGAEEVQTKVDDVRCDAFVKCPETVVKVEVLWAPDGSYEEISANGWDYDTNGIRLRPGSSFGFWGNEQPADPRYSASPRGLPWYYTQVRVTSTVAEEIDPLIKEGVALAAASLLIRRNRAAKGLQSESIGDYSYSLRSPSVSESTDTFFGEAKSLLRPLRLGGGVKTP